MNEQVLTRKGSNSTSYLAKCLVKRGTGASLIRCNSFLKAYHCTHIFRRRGIYIFQEFALEPSPCSRSGKHATALSPRPKLKTQAAGKLPGSVTYLLQLVGRVELVKHSFNIKTTKLFMSAFKPGIVVFFCSLQRLGNGE